MMLCADGNTGQVISANTPLAEGSKLIWKLNAYRFLAEPYQITAESRVVNSWAFVVTALVLLLPLLFFRRRRINI